MSGNAREKRRFPPPWRVEQTTGGFAVYDAIARVLLGRVVVTTFNNTLRLISMTTDEARRIALAIARIPELMMK